MKFKKFVLSEWTQLGHYLANCTISGTKVNTNNRGLEKIAKLFKKQYYLSLKSAS
jgi:hypothetical protein